jgi:short-subunit dehydrogenase
MNILIFGATSGIGRELAKQYVLQGHNVAITGRRQDKLDEIERENSTQYFSFHNDIRKTELIPSVIAHAHQKMGQIDLIIVNSGIGKFNLELDWEVCESVLKTNIIGVTKALTASYSYFYKQKKGHLVNVSSVASLIGNGANPSYNASKAFQANFVEGLWIKAQKSKKSKIYITDIRPGFVDTKLAQGDTFWMADVPTAAKQIINAIRKKKKVAYITKRWCLVAWAMKRLPKFIKKKM